jgi:hypothetical protein
MELYLLLKLTNNIIKFLIKFQLKKLMNNYLMKIKFIKVKEYSKNNWSWIAIFSSQKNMKKFYFEAI